MESIRRLVSIGEARHLLGGIGHTTVYELIKRREIVKVNIGRRGFITSDSLDSYLNRLSEASHRSGGTSPVAHSGGVDA